MKHVFVDACYWVALANPKDQLHQPARDAAKAMGKAILHTTDEVLTEYLNYYSGTGPEFRARVAKSVSQILQNANIRVHPQTRERFAAALSLYEQRLDKGYSLVDCASFVVMRAEKITEALTNDNHFTQEQFVALIK